MIDLKLPELIGFPGLIIVLLAVFLIYFSEHFILIAISVDLGNTQKWGSCALYFLFQFMKPIFCLWLFKRFAGHWIKIINVIMWKIIFVFDYVIVTCVDISIYKEKWIEGSFCPMWELLLHSHGWINSFAFCLQSYTKFSRSFYLFILH